MSVDYNETDSGLPSLVFCNDFQVVISNATFAKSFVSFVESEMVFKLNSLSAHGLSFKVTVDDDDNPEDSILFVTYRKLPMGYVRVRTIKDAMIDVRDQLKNLKGSA